MNGWLLVAVLFWLHSYRAAGQGPIYDEAADNGTYGVYPVLAYATEDNVTAPRTNFLQWSERCDDGLFYFITPRGWSIDYPGPMILDQRGELVWSQHFANDFGGQAYEFRVQQYHGTDYLTFWLGDDRIRGHGSGFYYMLNSSYDVVHRVGAANDLSADLHEFLITPDGTALMTMYQIVPYNLSQFRSFDPDDVEDQDPHFIWDCLFQEVSVTSGELVFEWRASDHLNLTETYHEIGRTGTLGNAFDWFHINSIDKDELGNFLISARYTHSITYIDGRSGDIIWTLGGKSNNFMDLSDGMGINFAWQHDARFLPLDAFPNIYQAPPQRPGHITRLLTLFDNAAEDQHYDYGVERSRGLLLEISYPTNPPGYAPGRLKVGDLSRADAESVHDLNDIKVMAINGSNKDYTVRVIRSYINPKGVRSSSQGSLQFLPQGPGLDPKILIGYGLNAVWTEFDANGTVLCDVHFGAETSWERGDIQSYRAYKFSWTGRPETRPLVEISDDEVEVYVSWNGATEVTDWVLQCSDKNNTADSDWAEVTAVPKKGFETIIPVPASVSFGRYLRVIALDRSGRRPPYGTSDIIDRGVVATYMPVLNIDVGSQLASVPFMKISLLLVANTSLLFALYELYRRYLSWKYGRPGAGPMRWRKGFHYRLLSDASSV